MELKQKTVIVTGGGRGIGREICVALARKGANIVVAARTKSEIQNTKKDIEKIGSQAIAVSTDITQETQVKNLMIETINSFGSIHVLINDAGVAIRKKIKDMSLKDYDSIMNVNLKGMFLCTKYALPYLEKQKEAIIINISSGAGRSGIPELGVYCASKFGVIGLTESLAGEVPNNLKAYAVCPGGVDTGMYRSLFKDKAALEPEYIAAKIIELCEEEMLESGRYLEIYH
jgi:NAD(P)-dependent dehydrogenase (short-subunit alcohol dehydrogenase family)